jgi:hypothetical protein
MKILMMLLVLLGVSKANSQKDLTRDEKRFVKNVIKLANEKLGSIVKRADSYIVLEFPTTIYVLRPDGYIGEVWILGDSDWISLGTEQDAY